MAKKKKRRPTASNRPASGAGQVATTTKARGPEAPAPIKPAPSTPGGPNRQARKDEARRQREAIRRRMARRRFLQHGGIAALVILVVAGVGVYVALKPNAAKAAGCGSGQTIKPYPQDEDRAHIGLNSAVPQPPALSTYPSTPPVSGPHNQTPLGAGVYTSPPDIYRTIHSLEHGAVIIWFAPRASGNAALQKIETFYRQAANNDHVIVAPYNYPNQGAAGALPAGKQMVLVAWHHLQACTQLSLEAAKGFVSGYRAGTSVVPAGYKGDAPEAGSAI
jgi:hypothetical protein